MADQLTVRRGSPQGGLTRELDPLRRMREMLQWDPFQEMSRLMPTFDRPLAFIPAFEVKETSDAYVFKADLPGVKEQDLDITVTGNRLTLSGTREVEDEQQGESYFISERSYGAFTRTFTLPEGVDPDQVRAELKEGVLNLVVPKKPEMQPKKITIQGKSQKVKA